MKKASQVVLTVVMIGVVALMGFAAAEPANPGHPEFAVPCKIVRVHSGDVLTVECKLVMDVKLLDCHARDLRKDRGETARQALAAIADGKSATLHVPIGRNVSESLSFGRVLGKVEINGVDVSTAMVSSGYATKEKRPVTKAGRKRS